MSVDFALLLFVLTVAGGLMWAFDAAVLAPKRRAEGRTDMPVVVEYARSLFPVILIIFLLRSFVAEPFRIPSSSMEPTLEEGDLILVSKFAYGIRLPVLNRLVVDLGTPERGDVVVFRFPQDPRQDYIKRVVGLPGDEIVYIDKRLYVNGELVQEESLGPALTEEGFEVVEYGEKLGEVEHRIYKMPRRHDPRRFDIVVPEGRYFVMGDNRDNSNDSRGWGFVPDENLVGRAFLIWMNWRVGEWPEWNRIGTVIR